VFWLVLDIVNIVVVIIIIDNIIWKTGKCLKIPFYITVEITESICDDDGSQHEAYMRTQLLQDGKKKYVHIIKFNNEFAIDMYIYGGGGKTTVEWQFLSFFSTHPNVTYDSISYDNPVLFRFIRQKINRI
jgi:hypothetical protein